MSCRALYLHIPFCERKCPYCDFYSLPSREDWMDAYTQALLHAIECQPFDIEGLDTVYLGGGTPSVLGARRLGEILEAVSGRFSVAGDAEITVECNPHSALLPTLRALYAAGANRLSFGMQSADDRQLARLGRLHTAADITAAVNCAVRCGFTHLSLDLMLATPGQRMEDIDRAAALCDSLGAEHVSAYLLKIEEGTPFERDGVARDCPDEDGQVQAYLHAAAVLAGYGYRQYEISNFARENRVGRHNLNYWDCGEYLGVGPSAHAFIDGRRCFFPRDLKSFLQAEDPFSLLVDDGPGGDAQEYLMLRLRLTEGVKWESLAARYPGYDREALLRRARKLPESLLVCTPEGFHLTTEGFLLSNAVIGELLA